MLFRDGDRIVFAGDRVHPNTLGSTLIAKEFLKYCESELNPENQVNSQNRL